MELEHKELARGRSRGAVKLVLAGALAWVAWRVMGAA